MQVKAQNICFYFRCLLSLHIAIINQAGDVIECALSFSDGSLDHKIIYKYDSSGNVIEDAIYYGDETEYYGEALLPQYQTVYEITYRK